MGYPRSLREEELDEDDYEYVQEEDYYIMKRTNPKDTMTDYTYVRIETNKNKDIAYQGNFKGRGYRIYEKRVKLEKEELRYIYKYGAAGTQKAPMLYNEKIIGMTLLGEVEKTEKEEVYISLRIDKGKKGLYPYPFRPETGNMMYNMPQKGTTVSLYMPSHDERSAMIINSIRTNTSDDMTDPDKKTFRTEHNKKLDLYPKEITLQSNTTGSGIRETDEEGINICSHKKIEIIAEEGIKIRAPKIKIETKKEMELIRGGIYGIAEGSIVLSNQIDIKSQRETKVIGRERNNYAPIEDGPVKKEFDWGKLGRNILGGLVVVGAVALTLATFGAAGPIIVGAAIGGAIAVGMTAVGDIVRGEISSENEYIFSGFTGAVTGAISGGINMLKLGKAAKIAIEVGEGIFTGAGESMASQMVLENKTLGEIDYRRVGINAGVSGGIAIAVPMILEIPAVKKYTSNLTNEIKAMKEREKVLGIVAFPTDGNNIDDVVDAGLDVVEEGTEKVGKGVVKESSEDITRKIQKETIENAAPFSELKNYQKGNLGEIITDIGIEDQLNTTRVGDRITDINKGGHH